MGITCTLHWHSKILQETATRSSKFAIKKMEKSIVPHRLNLFEMAIMYAKKAIEWDNQQHYEKAFETYIKSLDYLLTYAKQEKDASRKSKIYNKTLEILKRAEELKHILHYSESEVQIIKNKATAEREKDQEKRKSLYELDLERHQQQQQEWKLRNSQNGLDSSLFLQDINSNWHIPSAPHLEQETQSPHQTIYAQEELDFLRDWVNVSQDTPSAELYTYKPSNSFCIIL